MPTKKRNRQDSTILNVRAANKHIKALEERTARQSVRLHGLENDVEFLFDQVNQLVNRIFDHGARQLTEKKPKRKTKGA